MKKVILSLTLMLAIVIASGYKPAIKNEPAGKATKEKAPAAKPKILLMLNNSTGMSKWSPSLWWKYEHAKPGQIGC